MRARLPWLGAAALTVAALIGFAMAHGPSGSARASAGPPDPRPQPNSLKNAYFGDLHVHTMISVDSFLRRNRLNMADAYRYAQGGEVVTAGGVHTRLDKPLDFVALTDHSESYSIWDLCAEGQGPASKTEGCQALKAGEPGLGAIFKMGDWRSPQNCEGPVENCLAAQKRVWTYVQKIANQNYKPGLFTTFIAYEFTAGLSESGTNTEAGGHMHRNVIYANEHVPDTVFTALDGQNTKLWAWLEKACAGPCDVVAIPHNTNLSFGYQFALETPQGNPYTDEDFRRKSRFERLVEIYQSKGASECNALFGSTDEECGFEPFYLEPCPPHPTKACIGEGSFIRPALKTGLALQQRLGFNPFKLGFVGGSDNHNALAGVGGLEKNFPGSIGIGDDTPEKRLDQQLRRSPGAITGIWATANTRPALFASLKSRETFATSGPRIVVRVFAGWDLPADVHRRSDYAALGYRLGVPMGGDLPAHSGPGAPQLSIRASADPSSQRLSRIQVIKGWRGEPGKPNEAVYDVACSDRRAPDPATHRCPDNGARVDLSDCSTTPGKGAADLAVTWRDPDFDPNRPAFYYVRVLETPSCRWSTWDALRAHRPIPPFRSPVQEERAWTSPVWYGVPKGPGG